MASQTNPMDSQRVPFATVVAPRRRWWPLAGGLATGVALAVLWCFNPGDFSLPLCTFHALTGLHCPGCGASRAVHQLLHGNLYAALRLNPLLVVAIPLLAYPLTSAIVHRVQGRPLPRALVSGRWFWVLLAVVVLFGILRNIPQYPFTLLAPS
jgi:hypothetical protein